MANVGKRIPMRIYRLNNDATTGTLYSPLITASPNDAQFVQNKTVDDISLIPNGQAGRIFIAQGDLPGLDGFTDKMLTAIYDKERSLYYVSIDEFRWYIRGNTDNNPLFGVPRIFEFYINPQNIQPSYKKLITETRTRGGFEVQHWGSALTEVRVTGKTGGLHRNVDRVKSPGIDPSSGEGQTLGPSENIMESTAWRRLTELKRLYNFDHSDRNREASVLLGLNYYDRFFIGYFSDFTGPEADAENPYIMSYSFTFKVQNEVSTSEAVSYGVNL